jgi:hypothetical protein
MRWLDDVESDLKKMEVKGWKEKMGDREQWRPRLTEGCSAEWQAGRLGDLHAHERLVLSRL